MVGCYKNNNGFTLVEILTVLVVMGLVMAPVYSTYLNTKRNSKTSVEVVDLQQNIRAALETMTADIRMAGFLIPDDDNPVNSIPASLSDTNVLSLNLATSTGVYTRVVGDFGTFSSQTDIDVADKVAEKFRKDQGVRIISPTNPNTENDVPADDVTDLDANAIRLTPSSPITINNRDIMMQMNEQDDDAFPVIVRYRLNSEVLERSVNSTTDYETIATNITSIDLSAIPPGAPLEEIRAIRIIVSGKITTQVSSNAYGDKDRAIQTVVKIENYFEG
jgi:prepilin-type N-terminal cleavage/methylation domain-containing protein